MEKKFKFSDNPNFAKTVYAVVIALLCIGAIVIGIIAANTGSTNEPQADSPVIDNTQNGNTENKDPGENEPSEETPGVEEKPIKKPEKKSFLAPVSGSVTKGHSLTVPVFSTTLEEWRVHSGIDIGAESGSKVFAAFDGEVEKIYSDPLLGCTVVVDHGENVKTYYSNLNENELSVSVGDEIIGGEAIGVIVDSSISELAEEPHLHFEVSLGDSFVDPLEYISDESKSVSLGIS